MSLSKLVYFRESNNCEDSELNKKHQPQCSLPESAGGQWCSLFLGQLDQGLVGNAESTHVNRPRGKAFFVPRVSRCCTWWWIIEWFATRMLSRLTWWKLAGACHIEQLKKPVSKQGWDGGHKLSIEVEALPVPQKTTKSHETSPSASRVKQRQWEGTEPYKGTVRERKRASLADSWRTASDRDRGALSPATVPTGAETREGRYWERSTRRRRTSKGSRNK